MNSRRPLGSTLVVLALLTASLLCTSGTSYGALERRSVGPAESDDSARALLEQTLNGAVAAGSYGFSLAMDQTVLQEQPWGFAPAKEYAHFEIAGTVAGPERARLEIKPGRTSFVIADREAQELLVVEGAAYRRVSERWVRDDSNVASVEIEGIGLSMLSAAREVEHLERPLVELQALVGKPAAGS